MSRRFILIIAACSCMANNSLVSSEELLIEATALQRGWPTVQGPNGNFSVPRSGVKLVDDLSKVRLVWESEDRDAGRAKHTTGTFKAKSRDGSIQKILDVLGPNPVTTPGGWAAPIIADGKVFVTSFKPAGKLYEVKSLYGGTAKAYLEAENLLIALDAQTGKLLWKAREPDGFVWGVGKRMGFQVAPVCHDGMVYSMGTTGSVYAYLAKDGKKYWENKAEPYMQDERAKHLAKSHVLQASANYGWQQSLVFAGGHVIVPRQTKIEGVDLDDGAVVWTRYNIISKWCTPSVWKHNGKDYLLCPTGGKPGQAKLNLVDPTNGEIIWTLGKLHATQFNLSPCDDHVLVNVGSSLMMEKPNASAPKDDQGQSPYGLLGAYKLTLQGAEHVWTFPDKPHFLVPIQSDNMARVRVIIRNGLVYLTTGGPDKLEDRRFIIARLDTGKVLVDAPRKGDFWFQLIEGKLLYCHDWSHGKRASWSLYDASPQSFRKLSGPWSTAHPLTTSYQVLMEPPIISGQIFLRTETGSVVCYDLRQK